MRTTLSLDEDVAAELRQLAEKRGGRWKETVNEALRAGLILLRRPEPRPPPYTTPVVDTGRPLLAGIESVSEMLELAEGDGYPR